MQKYITLLVLASVIMTQDDTFDPSEVTDENTVDLRGEVLVHYYK